MPTESRRHGQIPSSLAVADDGTLYFDERLPFRAPIRRVKSNGIIDTVAGGGALLAADGIRATSADLGAPNAIEDFALAPDGTMYLAAGGKIWAVATDGMLKRIAGTGVVGSTGDGGPALLANMGSWYCAGP